MQVWNRIWRQHLNRLNRARKNSRFECIGDTNIAVQIESLAPRRMLSAAPVAVSTIQVEHPLVTAGPTGYSPNQLQTAYSFNQVSFSSGANGTGQTIAIVDAYNAPTIQSDLKAFDAAFGLADPPSFTVMSQTGSTTSLPPTDPSINKQSDWEVEEALDVEWAHALAPGARIVLVEANSANMSDLMAAVKTAASIPNVSVVSMSWGGGEFSGENVYDSAFKTPAGHQGITFVASTGDDGEPGGFPAYSPNVLAAGGTTLRLTSSGAYQAESAWSGSGGGISQYEAQPAYQKGVVTQSTTNRTIPDVAFDADPNTGVPVYDSFSNGSSTPWSQIGGTSLSAPAWGALISIIDQSRVQNGLTTLDGATQTLPMLYKLDQTTPSAFHDITSGSNGFAATAGYDLVTGLGSPIVNVLVPGMDGATSTSNKLVFQQSPSTGVAGQILRSSVTVAVENSVGQILTGNNSTVTISVGSGAGGFTNGSTLSVQAVNGIATFNNLTLTVAGTYTLSAADSGITASATHSLTISPAVASKLVLQQVPSTGKVNQTLGSVSVAVEDQYGNIVTGNNSTVTIGVASGPGLFSTGSTTSVATVNGIATFKNLVLGTAGRYTLRATDASLTGATSTSISVTAGLAAPQNVAITASSSTIAQLTWSVVTGAQRYRIYQVSGTQSILLGSLNASATSVQLNSMSAGLTYSFFVEAFNSTSAADSKTVSVTMPSVQLAAPVVTGRILSASSVQLTWNPVAGAQGYRVYYSDGLHRYLLGTLSVGATTASINGLSNFQTYQFQVEAYRGSTVADSNWIVVNTSLRMVRSVVSDSWAFSRFRNWFDF